MWLRHTFAISLSLQLNCNSKNGSVVVHFQSTQRSIDGSASSELMELRKTLIVKTLNRQSHAGRPKSSRSPQNIGTVRDSVVRSPSKCVHGRSQELGINREIVRRILIADLNLYPFRIQIKQKLTPDDMTKRVIMCQWFCNKIDVVPDFLDNDCLVFV